jgi:hypothetical protein
LLGNRISFAADEEIHRRHVVIGLVLKIWEINRGRGRTIQAPVLHVTNDADDFAHARHVVARSSARPGVVNSDAFPNWIFAGPELPRSFYVDDGNRGRGGDCRVR